MDRKRLVVIDGYSLLYRAFFATRYLSTSSGQPTNALFGFTSMLFTLLTKERPDAILVALDAPGKTFRHTEYEGYKATRKETADELRVQLTSARDLIRSLNIQTLEVTGYEADDVVGTVTRLASEAGFNSLVVTGDLDTLQLVCDTVQVLTPGKGMTETVVFDPAAVEERYGFGSEFVPDFKALKGDASDNIPGVPGIGDKGAADLIQRYGTIETMIDRIDDMEPKYRKKLDGNQDQMRMSKWLATIVRDAPIKVDFTPYSLTEDQYLEIVTRLEELEFKSLARRARAVFGPYVGDSEGEASSATAQVIEEQIEVTSFAAASYSDLSEFVSGRPFAMYFSSTPQGDLFDEKIPAAFVSVDNEVRSAPYIWAIQLLSDRPAQAVLHDAKPLYRTHDKPLPAPGFDTMLAAFVLRSDRGAYKLLDLVTSYLELAPPTRPEQMAVAMGRLANEFRERLAKEVQEKVLHQVELPLIPILVEMEKHGIRTDRNQLREFSKELQVAIERSQQLIHEIAGEPFLIASTKQLGEVLFEKLKLPNPQKTKTGYATGAEVLSLLAAEYPIAAEVLTWRELSKLKSTYADALERLIAEDGRIHTTYNQAGAATGRFSSNDPNLQNIPIRTELGRSIRKAFVAADGYRLASLDYSQIELRVLADVCGEPALVNAFLNRQDVHTVTAQQMFGLETSAPTKEQRRLAKMLNYAILYGVTEYGLAQQLGSQFSVSEAKELIRLYNERFPTVKEFTQSVIVEARSKGFTVTALGRRRYHPDIHASRVNDRRYAERQAMNAPIQGTAADMMKLAMVKVHKTLQGSGVRMLLTVHDELLFEVPLSEEPLVQSLRSDMETALPLNVPVEVDAKIGTNWNEMSEVPRLPSD